MANKKTFLVTGGAGFIGSHVVDLLVRHGHRVHIVDDLSTGNRRNVNPKANLHVLDIRDPKLAALVKKIRPNGIIHLAAHIDLRRSVREPAHDASINLVGGLNVLAAATAAKVSHLTFASSAAVYGSAGKVPWPENRPLRPSSPYGIAKFSFEHYLRAARELYGIKSAALRFANVYGPRQSTKGEAGVVAIFLQKMLGGEAPIINGDGKQTRDYVFVEDIARFVVLAAERGLDGVWNASTGREADVNEITRQLVAHGKFKTLPVHGPGKPGEDRRVALDTRKSRRLGWHARVTLEEGLKRTYRSFAEKK